MDKQYLTIVYRLPPGYEASQLCQHEHAVVLSWSHMKEDREELRAENEKLKANLDRHMEVIVKGRAANEALNREIVATKMLAGNPQAIIDLQKELAALKQASEPVGYVTHSGMSAYINAGLNLDDDTPLYLHPALSYRDAERYRWLKSQAEEGHDGDLQILFRCDFDNWNNLDAAIDAAMEGGK